MQLVKFTNYAESLLKGTLYLNPIEYYRGVDQILNGHIDECPNDAVNDVFEGNSGYISLDEAERLGLHFPEKIKADNPNARIALLCEGAKFVKVFCAYAPNPPFTSILTQALLKFGTQAVIIRDVQSFWNRVTAALKFTPNAQEAFAGLVRYYNTSTEKVPLFRDLSIWNKRHSYAWQNEFRLAVFERQPSIHPLILKIGSISDIACIVPAKDVIAFPDWYLD